MAIYEIKTFGEIVSAIREELGVQSADTTSVNKIKRVVNSSYLQEIVPFDQWVWLRDSVDLSQEAAIETGTVAVTESSTAITFSSAPVNSVEGYWFSIQGQGERYRIAKHTAASTSAVLSVPFTNSTATAASYTLWSDAIPLPANCKETLQVSHDFSDQPLEAKGLQRFLEIAQVSPKLEGRPYIYSTNDYVDPVPFGSISGLPALSTSASSGLIKTLVFASTVAAYLAEGDEIEISGSAHYSFNGKFKISSVSTTTVTFTGKVPYEQGATADASLTVKLLSSEKASEYYRELLVYPAVVDTRTTLHVTYLKNVVPLEDDADEPVIPREDRLVLVYAALSRLWASMARNPEEAARNQQLYDRKLSKMAAKSEDSTDYPVLQPDKLYLATKRRGQRWARNWDNE